MTKAVSLEAAFSRGGDGMAYDPTIPNLDNYVGDDIPKMLENFAALAGSVIVDHNLDVSSPPSGWYVRLANGLQLVLTPVSVDTTQNAAHSFTSPVTFKSNTPKFAAHSFTSFGSSAARQNAAAVIGVAMTLGTTSTISVATNGTGTSTDYTVHAIIIGFW